jgi:predicted site-specific integrase-resolvase
MEQEARLIFGQKDLAKALGVEQATVSRWQTAGKFEGCYYRVGKKVVYNLDAILEKFKG